MSHDQMLKATPSNFSPLGLKFPSLKTYFAISPLALHVEEEKPVLRDDRLWPQDTAAFFCHLLFIFW